MLSPILGCFLTRDAAAMPGEPDLLSDNNWFGQNLDAMVRRQYTYASNNPVNFVDPSGRAEFAPNQPAFEADPMAMLRRKKGAGHIVIDPSCAGYCFWMKPEDGPKRWECTTGTTFDADGVWGLCFKGHAFKVVDGCTLTISCKANASGKVHGACDVQCEGWYSRLGQTLTGGCVVDPWTGDPPKVPGPSPGPTLPCLGDCEVPEVLAPPGM